MKDRAWSRRSLIRASVGAGILGLSGTAKAALSLTPGQSEGPFYPRSSDLFYDTDNDLVKLERETREAGGSILHLAGSVLRMSGQPVENARVEIWQCDANGRYLHRRDQSGQRQKDQYFQGFGKTETGEDGEYRFRTIRPVPYPGRTPHIHFKIFSQQLARPLTTQMYVQDEPLNREDFLFNRLDSAGQRAVTIKLDATDNGDFQGRFDIVIDA
jgi:protocatechuate 3,4-dioxygenase beta subunit